MGTMYGDITAPARPPSAPTFPPLRTPPDGCIVAWRFPWPPSTMMDGGGASRWQPPMGPQRRRRRTSKPHSAVPCPAHRRAASPPCRTLRQPPMPQRRPSRRCLVAPCPPSGRGPRTVGLDPCSVRSDRSLQFRAFSASQVTPTAVLRKIPHSNCCKTVPKRPLRGRRGRFGTLLQLLKCGIFWRTAVRIPHPGLLEFLETCYDGMHVPISPIATGL